MLKKDNTNYYKELVFSYIKMLEIHDDYTKGHSQNVARIAVLIANKLNLPKKTIETIYWTGMVHDIGKILIPRNILKKKTSLKEEEFDIIKNHPVWGYKTLSESESFKHISKYVLYHHEYWDGNGYPTGLKGQEIPLVSQIISVADAWDAMRSNRVYRSKLSKETAIQELIKNKGSQFSPQVVEAMLKVLKNK